MYSDHIVFEDVPSWDKLNRYLIGSIASIPLIVAFVLLFSDTLGAAIMFGVTVFDAVLFWCILPKRFTVYEDRLKIILGSPFSISIPFRDIIDVKKASRDMAYIYWGMRLGTSQKFQVEIQRRNGLGVIISPSMEEDFIEQLDRVRSGYRETPY